MVEVAHSDNLIFIKNYYIIFIENKDRYSNFK